MSKLPKYKNCFFCSKDEPTGVKLVLRYQEGAVICDFTLERRFQGFNGIAHGGIVVGILDELMWWTIAVETRKASMTRKMEAELLRPVRCDKHYTAKGKLLKQEHNTFWVSCVIEDDDGKATARGTAVFKLAKDIELHDMIDDLDFTHVAPEIREIFTDISTNAGM
jgi:uncharacterized protein (TIGR00369 family)